LNVEPPARSAASDAPAAAPADPEELSAQVARRLQAEHELDLVRGRLDRQMSLYRELFRVGRAFASKQSVDEILDLTARFVLRPLDLERCVLLSREPNGGSFRVVAQAGYRDGELDERSPDLRIDASAPVLATLSSAQAPLVCTLECTSEQPCCVLGQRFGLDELYMLALQPEQPTELLIAGNSAPRRGPYSPVRSDGEDLTALANLGSQAAAALRSARTLAHLRKQGRQLEERVRERTTRMQRAQRSAEDANRSKSAFLATMSHELRSPLSAVLGMAQLLQCTELDQEQNEFVEAILSSGNALLHIVNDVLDLSKIEAGKLQLEARPLAVRELVESCLEWFAPRATSKSVELLAEFAPEVPVAVIGDETRLRQVLVNLLSNAVKFTDAGEVHVRVGATPLDAERVRLELSVRDTGIGIPPGRMERVFEPYGQAELSTTRRYGGTGLGLAICRELAERMGGHLSASSAPERGSTFEVRIPARRAAVPLPAYLAPEQPKLAGRRVLVLVGHRGLRRVLADVLRGWGMVPVLVGRASGTPVPGAPHQRPDLAIVDGDRSPLAATLLRLEAQRSPGAPPPPVLLLSRPGDGQPSPVCTPVAASLHTPTKLEQLHATLNRLLDEPESGQASARRRAPSRTLLPVTPCPAPGEQAAGPGRVLIVDDDPLSRALARSVVQRLGLVPTLVEDGYEALALLQRRDFELVLMDLWLPGLDGAEVTRRIREELPQARQPCIVALTAGARPEDRACCLEAGMDDYISKPFELDAFRVALERCAQRGCPVPPGTSRP